MSNTTIFCKDILAHYVSHETMCKKKAFIRDHTLVDLLAAHIRRYHRNLLVLIYPLPDRLKNLQERYTSIQQHWFKMADIAAQAVVQHLYLNT